MPEHMSEKLPPVSEHMPKHMSAHMPDSRTNLGIDARMLEHMPEQV